MNSKLIIAAVACLGLAACQPSDDKAGKKDERKAPEHTQGAERGAEQPAPAQPGSPTSYYENEQGQQVAEQANPAIDAQQDTANTAQAAEGDALHMSQQAEPQAQEAAAAQ